MHNDWITNNWDQLEKAAKNITRSHVLWCDLLNHCMLEFLEKPEHTKIITDGFAKFYIVRMMLNQWRSISSPFYKIYRKNDYQQVELDPNWTSDATEVEFDLEKIHAILDHMNGEKKNVQWYHAKLVELYAVTPNYSKLSEMTKISRTSISKSIERARHEIKQKYYK